MGKCVINVDKTVIVRFVYMFMFMATHTHAELTKRLNDQRIVNVNIYITLFIIY